MRCPPNGNQASDRSRSTVAGTRSTRPAMAPRPVARYTPCSSQARNPPAQRPRHVHPGHHRVLAADVADEVDGAVDQQQPPEVRVLALAEQVDPGLDRTSAPASASSASCSSPRPAKMGSGRARRRASDGGQVPVHEVDRHGASPTAEATRFIESSRTSPAANTPGTLVSSTNGARGSGHRRAQAGSSRSWPVTTNPLSSRATSGPSHWVRGEAPMNTNSQLDGTSSVTLVSRSASVSASRWPSPRPDTTSLRYPTATLGVEVIRSTRYRDIVPSSVAAGRPAPPAGRSEGGARPGRPIGRPDDVDVVALGLAGLAGVGAVVDAAAGELVEPLRLQPPVGDAGGHDERARLDLARAVEAHGPHRPAGLEADDVAARTISAPNQAAWAMARRVRSAPLSPLGNPR